MTPLRVYKFLVLPVCQQVGDEGVVIAEVQPEQPDTVFGIAGLERYAAGFEAALATARTAQPNGAPPAQVAQAVVAHTVTAVQPEEGA